MDKRMQPYGNGSGFEASEKEAEWCPHSCGWLCSGWQSRSASGAEAVSRCYEDRIAVVRRHCVASAERSAGVSNIGFVPCGAPWCSPLQKWACCWLRRRRDAENVYEACRMQECQEATLLFRSPTHRYQPI